MLRLLINANKYKKGVQILEIRTVGILAILLYKGMKESLKENSG